MSAAINNILSELPLISEEEIRTELKIIRESEYHLSLASEKLLSCVDLTSLSASDNNRSIRKLCQKAAQMSESGLPAVAAVCVYPVFVKVASEILQKTKIKLASVAGGFPSSQIPLSLKLREIKYAIDNGADEIDVVIPVGRFLAREYSAVADELCEIKACVRDQKLKVILETGLLNTEEVQKATAITILSGADFIKTSTGKEGGGATLEKVFVMAKTLSFFLNKWPISLRAGIKPSGGISEIADAANYAAIVAHILGEEYIYHSFFRIGTSRLTNKLIEDISPELKSYF